MPTLKALNSTFRSQYRDMKIKYNLFPKVYERRHNSFKSSSSKQVVQENIRRNEISEKITAKSYWVDYEFTYFLGIARCIAFY